MNSKIQIDLGHDGSSYRPVIKITSVTSDDVRDKLVRCFMIDRGYDSETLNIKVLGTGEESGRSVTDYEVVPVSNELEYFKQRISTLARTLDDQMKIDVFFDWLESVKSSPVTPQ